MEKELPASVHQFLKYFNIFVIILNQYRLWIQQVLHDYKYSIITHLVPDVLRTVLFSIFRRFFINSAGLTLMLFYLFIFQIFVICHTNTIVKNACFKYDINMCYEVFVL